MNKQTHEMGQNNSKTALTGTKIQQKLKLAEQFGENMLIASYIDFEVLQKIIKIQQELKLKPLIDLGANDFLYCPSTKMNYYISTTDQKSYKQKTYKRPLKSCYTGNQAATKSLDK